MKVLGFMTGTSLDAIDMAVIETDGIDILELAEVGEEKLDPLTRALAEHCIEDAFAWDPAGSEPPSFRETRLAVARAHVAAARTLFREHPRAAVGLDLAGVHGQTVLHAPPQESEGVGRSIQLVDAPLIADALGIPVVHDFRSADMAAGGQGAPLAPAYHAALVRRSQLPTPVAVLNLGGVANVTLVQKDYAFHAFDTGPANGMIDQLVQGRTGERMDVDGAFSSAGTVHADVLSGYLADEYFGRPNAKSLDRFHFPLQPVDKLSLSDAAATLTAFAAEAIGIGLRRLRPAPIAVIAAGGGRRNPALMEAIRAAVKIPIITAEDVGWRGDSLEAEAFAFLAARSALGLPISFPATTGVARPLCGGVIARPRATPLSRGWRDGVERVQTGSGRRTRRAG